MQKLIKFLIASVVLFAFVPFSTHTAQASTFPDVDPTSEAGIAIEKLARLGIVTGRPNGKFAPGDSITRAEAAKIMYGILELEPYDNKTGKSTFPDVTSKHWAINYINTITEWEIMKGHANGNFAPDDKLTRGQMAVILKNGLKLPDGPTTLPFTDVKKSDYFFGDVASLLKANITKGRSETKFAPNDNVTRAELALFLNRSGILDELLNDEDEFDIIDIAMVDGVAIDEVRFRQSFIKAS